jgi:radical SAM modification target selenobiotic family peptide
MDIIDVKKVLAGLCVATLVSGAAICTAQSPRNGNLILAS